VWTSVGYRCLSRTGGGRRCCLSRRARAKVLGDAQLPLESLVLVMQLCSRPPRRSQLRVLFSQRTLGVLCVDVCLRRLGQAVPSALRVDVRLLCILQSTGQSLVLLCKPALQRLLGALAVLQSRGEAQNLVLCPIEGRATVPGGVTRQA
jgi:hypothetical protein